MFSKDILVIDFEGFHYPKQIGAVLLDKDTLEEKDYFETYIYADMGNDVSLKSGITQETLNDAPQKDVVAKTLYEKFGTNVLLAFFVADLDIQHLKNIMNSAGIEFSGYDYHRLDVWPLAYTHLIKKGYKGKLNSEEIFQAFGTKPRGNHNALEDSRITADILRKIIFDK